MRNASVTHTYSPTCGWKGVGLTASNVISGSPLRECEQQEEGDHEGVEHLGFREGESEEHQPLEIRPRLGLAADPLDTFRPQDSDPDGTATGAEPNGCAATQISKGLVGEARSCLRQVYRLVQQDCSPFVLSVVVS